MSKPVCTTDVTEVIYNEERWQIFERLRARALEVMKTLVKHGFNPIVHGSIARGDVDKGSDVDVFVPYVVPSYQIELALRELGSGPVKREIVMATPWQLPKAHAYLEEDRSVTFPLVEPRRLELEFYHFGGAAEIEQVQQKTRMAGVDKRLMLIEPTPRGHLESRVIGKEAEVAKRVGVSLELVRERVKVLTRRADVGHTGVFLQRELAPDENFETVFKRLVEGNPAVKLRLRKRLL